MAKFINGVWVYDENDKFDVTTGKPLGSVQGASTDGPPPRNDMTGAGYDALSNDPSYNPNAGNMPLTPGATPQSIANQNFNLAGGGSGGRYVPPTLSAGEAQNLASPYGFNPKEFSGMTLSQAMTKINEKKKAIGAQTSQNTSFTYNPQTISGFNDKVNQMKLKVDEANNYAWDHPQQKKDNSQAILKSYGDQLAGLFGSQEEFNQALQNPDMQKSLQQYQAMGGNPSDIASKIAKSSVVSVVGETRNPDGSYNVQYSDGVSDNRRYTKNLDGTYTSNEAQTTDEYLGNLNSPEAQKAYEDLIPEKNLAQQQIAFEQSIPEKFKDLYFGTEEEVGLIKQQQEEHKEKVKLLERRAELDKENARAQANYLIEKNNAEMEIETAEIAQNRLAAKNYMTGMLAKLGALNTTGAAPLALATLEQKYQMQTQKLRTHYKFANQKIQVELNERVNEIGLERDEDILRAKQDLSKSEEEVLKEVFKLQNEADRKTFSIIGKYRDDFSKRKDEYVKEAKSLAEKDLKERQRILEKFNPKAFLAQYGMTDQRKGKGGSGSSDVSVPSNLTFDAFIKSKSAGGQKANIAGLSVLTGGKSLGKDAIKNLVPEYIDTLLNSGQISTDLQAVLAGESSLSSYTPTVRTKVQREMTKLGVTKEMIKETEEDDFGELSNANKEKGINYILSNKGSKEDVEKFKTDRGFQAFIMSKL